MSASVKNNAPEIDGYVTIWPDLNFVDLFKDFLFDRQVALNDNKICSY